MRITRSKANAACLLAASLVSAAFAGPGSSSNGALALSGNGGPAGVPLFRKGDMGYDSFRGTVLLQEVALKPIPRLDR